VTAHPQLPSWLLPAGSVRRPFKAERPVPMPRKAPACFDSQEVYGKYKVLAQLTATKGYTYCTDCTPAHRDAMKAAGRCAYPGTTFARNNGVIVGRRAK